MNVCIPVNEPQYGASPVCAHFGSAPAFLIVNTDVGTYRTVVTGGQHMCGAIGTLQSAHVEGVIVGTGPGGLRAARKSAAVKTPPEPTSVNWMPALAAATTGNPADMASAITSP